MGELQFETFIFCSKASNNCLEIGRRRLRRVYAFSGTFLFHPRIFNHCWNTHYRIVRFFILRVFQKYVANFLPQCG